MKRKSTITIRKKSISVVFTIFITEGEIYMGKTTAVLVVIDNSVVLYCKEEKRILQVFNLAEEQIKQEIDKIIKEKSLSPANIFKKAVENILFPYKFLIQENTLKIAGRKISIHDQDLFKEFKEYITSLDEYKESARLFKEEKEKRRQEREKFEQINQFLRESVYKKMKYKHLPY